MLFTSEGAKIMCVPLSVKLVCARGIVNVATLQCASVKM